MSDTETILKLLKKISKEERQEVYFKLGKVVKNERSKYLLTAEQKIAIQERTEKLYRNSKGDIPKYIFGHRRYHQELNNDIWHD